MQGSKVKKIYSGLIFGHVALKLVLPCLLVFGCAVTPSNNAGFLMETTGQYQAQDTDSEQNGEQEFEGQLDYLQEQQQDKQQQQNQSNQITNQMSKEYQQQIQQQESSTTGN